VNLIQATILGLVQGLTEFLPVSSSGHLVLFKDILGLEEVPLLFDIILHLATLVAIALVFRRRIAGILLSCWRRLRRSAGEEDAANLALVLPFLAATVLTAAMGFAIQRFLPVEGTTLVSAELLVTALVLALSGLLKPGTRDFSALGIGRGLFIGFAQGLGVFSGISRSGMTISAGLAMGLKREEAGELSFLLAIPVILGAFILDFKDLGEMGRTVQALPLAWAFALAFVSGYFALRFLMRIVKGGRIAWFAVYLVPVSLAGLFLL
jgi:undecaprenyl-diphosphatase